MKPFNSPMLTSERPNTCQPLPLWNVQVYAQGKLISIDIVEEAAVQPMTSNYENEGYEVRSEPAWKPAQSTSSLPGLNFHSHQLADLQTSAETRT